MTVDNSLPGSHSRLIVSIAAFEVTPLFAAAMFVVLAATPVATPTALIGATAVLDDTHVAVMVRFCVLR